MNMRAYMYAGIFVKHRLEGKSTEARYGTFTSYPEITREEVEKVVLLTPTVFPLIEQGYSMEAFDFMLIAPEIAPMNKENHE